MEPRSKAPRYSAFSEGRDTREMLYRYESLSLDSNAEEPWISDGEDYQPSDHNSEDSLDSDQERQHEENEETVVVYPVEDDVVSLLELDAHQHHLNVKCKMSKIRSLEAGHLHEDSLGLDRSNTCYHERTTFRPPPREGDETPQEVRYFAAPMQGGEPDAI